MKWANAMKNYVIWSNEHGLWWAPGLGGYTPYFHTAGRYSEEEARGIVYDANCYLDRSDAGRQPNEVAIAVTQVIDWPEAG